MQDLYASIKAGKPQEPEHNTLVLSHISMLRSCLGKFLLPEELNEPFKTGFLGRCLKSGENSEKKMIWYQVYEDFSVLCFISEIALNNDIGPKLLCRKFNSEGTEIKVGLYNPLEFSISGISLGSEEIREIIRNAGIFLQNAKPEIDNERFLIAFRQVAADKILFGIQNKSEFLADPDSEVVLVFFFFLKIAFLAGFAFYCYRLRFPVLFFSIQQKLFVLFLLSGT
ncbi:MAG: hypothetical protein JXL97_01340, partial [Bacteroidales bacterium]|nr:hypothetical protein [Bacteroidales bacterium]